MAAALTSPLTSPLLSPTSPLSAFPVSEAIRTTLTSFQEKKGEWLTETVQHLVIGDIHYYGIHRDKQMATEESGVEDREKTEAQYRLFKSHLLSIMEIDPREKLYQIIGDSAAFSHEGTVRGRDFLLRTLPSSSPILYGYTGHAEADGRRCVNALVSDVAKETGLFRTIANVVGFHTPVALEKWGCTGPVLSHYIVVYGDDESKRETGTVFGDDVTTSDFLCDEALLLEGGVQSFRQACNFLRREIPIHALSGLRTKGSGLPYFSATQFLLYIQDQMTKTSDVTDEVLDNWYAAYFRDHLIADPTRADYDTKKKLMDEAWELFKAHKLYEHIAKTLTMETVSLYE